jgi:hypothetical protein
MKQVTVFLVREKDGSFSCCPGDDYDLPYGLIGEGDTVEAAIAEWYAAYDDMRKSFERDGEEFVEAEFTFAYDVPTFLIYYAGKITYAGLSKLTGISSSQLCQYAKGYRNPSLKTTKKIQNALYDFGSDLRQIRLIKQ